MTKKRWFIIIISIIAVIMVTVLIVSSLPKYDEEEIEIFEMYKEDFEKINEYIINYYGGSLEKNILIDRQISWIVGLYDRERIKVSKELQESFNNIDKAFMGYDFSFIEISSERISYQGDGYRMYVYSRGGKVPDYYYYKKDGMNPDVYKLGDNWYLLKVNYR